MQGLVDAVGVATTGGGQVLALATTAADRLHGVGDDLAGVEPTLGIDRRGDGDPFATRRADEHHGLHSGAIAERDGEVADLVAGLRLDPCDEHTVDGSVDEVAGAGLGDLAAQRGDLGLLRPVLVQTLAQALGDVAHRDPEGRRHLGQRALLGPDELDGLEAGDGLETPDVRADRRLGHDLERTDVTEPALHVGAAAELDRVRTGLQHPHGVAVLVAEERDGTQLHRLVLRHLLVRHRGVGQDLAVGEILDRDDLVGRQAFEVAEVESQTIGTDPRTLLLDVRAEHTAQRPVEDVGGGVVAPDGVAPIGIDRGGDDRARGEAGEVGCVAGGDDVTHQPGQGVGGVDDVERGAVPRDRPGVTDLAAGFGIEGRDVEHDRVADRGDDPGRRLVDLAADERRLAVLVEDRPELAGFGVGGDTGGLCSSLRVGPLVGHGGLEAGHVELVATELGELLGHLEGEAVGVVQLEGDLAVEPTAGRERRQLAVEERRTGLEGLAELRLLPLDRRQDQVPVADELGVGVAHHPDATVDHLAEHQPLDAGDVREADGTADDAAQDVAAILVGRNDPVGHEERHGAGVVGHEAEGHIGDLGFAEPMPGDPLRLVDEHRQHVGGVQRRTARHQRQDALHTGAGVDVLLGEVAQLTVRAAEVLGEHEVPDLDESVLGLGVGRATVGTDLGAVVVEQLR